MPRNIPSHHQQRLQCLGDRRHVSRANAIGTRVRQANGDMAFASARAPRTHRQRRGLEEDVGRWLLRAGRRGRAFLRSDGGRNRRQGLSVIQVDGLLVLNSIFKNTHGTRPSAGIDFEPDGVEQKISNVRIVGSKFIDNAGPGILVAGKKARVTKIEMTRNTFRNNPVVVEYAPSLAAAICGNRETSTATEHRRLQCLCRADRGGRAAERLWRRRLCRGPAEKAQEAPRGVGWFGPSPRPLSQLDHLLEPDLRRPS